MPFSHDRPNLERSPAAHRAEAVDPARTGADLDRLLAAMAEFDAPDGPLLDLACGDGRHVAAAVARGLDAHGIDRDPRMVAAARERHSEIGERVVEGDAAELRLPERFAAISLFNRSLAVFHSHRLAWGLFRSVAAHLLPGGIFAIDDCCTPLWNQIREGCFADGLSEDGREQLLFLPGENRFVWRRGDEVDPECWEVRPDDRIFRCWSLGEIALAAAGVGLAPRRLAADTGLLILRKTEG